MIFWTCGLLLALGLVWFVAAMAVPLWRVREFGSTKSSEELVKTLGGPRRALWRLQLYAWLPERIAPSGEKAVYALGWCGPEAVPTLRKALLSKHPEVRHHAAKAIISGPLGPQARAAVPELILMLTDRDSNLRSSAAEALGRIGAEASGSIPALRRALSDEPQNVKRMALLALGAIGPDARSVLDDVMRFLDGNDEVLKADAVLAVAGITRDGRLVMDSYSRIAGTGLGIDDSLYLYEISEEMRGIGDGVESLAPLMEKLLSDKDEDVRAYASRILRRIPGHESAPVIEFSNGEPAY